MLLSRAGGDEPWRATAWALRGDALARAGAYERAPEEYDHALALAPDLVRAHRAKAVTRGGTGDFLAALDGIDRVVANQPPLMGRTPACPPPPPHAPLPARCGIPVRRRISIRRRQSNTGSNSGRCPSDASAARCRSAGTSPYSVVRGFAGRPAASATAIRSFTDLYEP